MGATVGPTYDENTFVRIYRRAVLRRLAEDPNVRLFAAPGREYLYRPNQLLARRGPDAERVLRKVREAGFEDARLGEGFAGVERVVFETDPDIPALVRYLRDPRQWQPREPIPAVQPHHVANGTGNIMGHPDGPPLQAGALPPPDEGRFADGAGVTVGIVDTGMWDQVPTFHQDWLHDYLIQPGDVDALFRPGSTDLDLQAGHGTFVAGVLRQAAAGVGLDPFQLLSPAGLADESQLAGALTQFDFDTVSIVNLSLGCQTSDNLPSQPLADAVSAVPEDVLLVAAAGNAGNNRPNYPAALSQVVAVAAAEKSANGLALSPYSNFGPWVDACAPGRWHSTYVTGTMPLPGVGGILYDGYATWTGTSFATPFVAGALARHMAENKVSAAQARSDLIDSKPRDLADGGVFFS
jgi:subtilisin family serine protease